MHARPKRIDAGAFLKPRRRYEESDNQRALIRWFGYAHRGLHVPDCRLLFSIPNGAVRPGVGAGILVAEGVRSGIPDLFLAVPQRGFGGLFIEMKAAKGVVQEEQKEMHSQLVAQKYAVMVCLSFEEARAAILAYLDLEAPSA
jgi:hypothetical protein